MTNINSVTLVTQQRIRSLQNSSLDQKLHSVIESFGTFIKYHIYIYTSQPKIPFCMFGKLILDPALYVVDAENEAKFGRIYDLY